MKKIIIGALIVFAGIASADYVEVKTGYGRDYYNITTRPKLYVCYDKRVRIYRDGMTYLRYDGCARYTNSCYANGLARFGRYPSARAARNALYRCRTAQPRFVD